MKKVRFAVLVVLAVVFCASCHTHQEKIFKKNEKGVLVRVMKGDKVEREYQILNPTAGELSRDEDIDLSTAEKILESPLNVEISALAKEFSWVLTIALICVICIFLDF